MTPCINALIAGRGDAKAPELLMLLFIVLMHDEKHECDASFAELAKAYGCNERNAKLLVAKLKKRDLLIVTKTTTEGHSRNVYRPATCGTEEAPPRVFMNTTPRRIIASILDKHLAQPPRVDAESQAEYAGEHDEDPDL